MKTALIGIATIAALIGTPVFAADMAVKAPPPSAVAYDWTGLYIGAHVGGGWQNATFSGPSTLSILNNCCLEIGDTYGPGVASSATGGTFLGGAQAGWMYQIGRLVVGADFDFSGSNFNGSGADTFSSLSFVGPIRETYSIKTDWTATATATLGIAHDRWMIYGKAGVALADESYNLAITNPGPPPFPAFSFASGGDRQIVPGWTTGIGVKWAISDNWFVNAEYDFLDFGTRAAHVSGTLSATPLGTPTAMGSLSPAASFEPLFNQTISEVKVGLNYKYSPTGSGWNSVADRPLPAQHYAWTGFYIGAHIGGGWQSLNIADPSALNVLTACCLLFGTVNDPTAISTGTRGSFLGGAQAGWMYQFGRLVVGMDVDFTGMNLTGNGSNTASPVPGILPGGLTYFSNDSYSVRTNWTVTSTANVGIANDLWMVYTKAGVAWADNTYGVNTNGVGGVIFATPPTFPYSFAGTANEIVPGWTIGLGARWAITNELFLNAEYDFVDFGTRVEHVSGAFSATLPFGGAPGVVVSPAATFNPVFSQTISEVKIGLNYKPGAGAGPLLAPENPKTDYTWSGFYVGGHIGGAWTDAAFSDDSAYPILNNCCILVSHTNIPGPAGDATGGGFLGGVQAGWMYQLRRIVVGADFDFSGSMLKANGSNTFTPIPTVGDFANESYSVRTDWTSTATTVIGLAGGSFMFYGKAGAAWAHNSYSLAVSGAGGNLSPGGATPFAFASSTHDTVVGWTAGAGVKWAISDNWFVNAEYDFLDFGTKAEDLPGVFTAAPQFGGSPPTAATFHPTLNPNISEVKIGLNYRFAPSLTLW
jgi:opacity protein-like surface antigen